MPILTGYEQWYVEARLHEPVVHVSSQLCVQLGHAGISHGGSIYTTEVGKCSKSELFMSEIQVLNIHQHTAS